MKYEHEINWTKVYNDKLDSTAVQLVQYRLILLLSNPTSNLSERMANLEVGTLYDCKNQTKSYDFLRTARVHALLLSISFKPIFVDLTPLIVC